LKLKYDQTTARQDVGIARTQESPGDRGITMNREPPGKKNRQEKRSARTEKSPGKAKHARENAKRLGNAKKKRATLG